MCILECCAIIIEKTGLIIVALYRPQSGNFKVFLELFASLLEILSNFSKTIVIRGDFNVDFLNNINNLALLEDLLGY